MLGRPANTLNCLFVHYRSIRDLRHEHVGHAPQLRSGKVPANAAAASSSPGLDGNSRAAGMNVNVWDVVDDVKGLIRSGNPVDADRLVDPQWPLAT